MNPYAAGLSIFVSMLSALTIIGWPVEAFLYGDQIVWRALGEDSKIIRIYGKIQKFKININIIDII